MSSGIEFDTDQKSNILCLECSCVKCIRCKKSRMWMRGMKVTLDSNTTSIWSSRLMPNGHSIVEVGLSELSKE